MARLALVAAVSLHGVGSARADGGFETPHDGYQQVHVPEVPLPDPAADAPVALDAILAYADRHAPRLRVARQRLEFGEAALAGAAPRLPANPTVTLGVGPGLNSGGDHVDVFGSVSQRFEIAGERGLRMDAAKHTGARYLAELDEARWEVHRDVHAAFHRTLVSRERLAAAERLLAFQERLLEIAQGNLRAGDVSPLAVRLAQGELSQARVERIAAQQAHTRARLELAALAGWSAKHPPRPAGDLDEPLPPASADVLVEAARRHQPRLRTLQAARVEAGAREKVAERDAWAEPTLGVQVMRENFRYGPPETQILGTLSLPIPIVQRNQGPRAMARARVHVADAERMAFESQLYNRIEQHRSAVLAAAEQVQAYGGDILPTFEESLRLIEKSFELGEIDILQVSVVRERFLRIQRDALDAYLTYFQAVADLEAAIGTDLWPEERQAHRHAAPAPESAP